MRTELRPQKKSSSLKEFKAKIRSLKHKIRIVERLNRKLDGQATQQVWYDSIPKKMLPSRIDAYETHVEFNRDIVVRNLILGGDRGNNPNFPPYLTSKAFEEVIKAGNSTGCKTSLSVTLIKKPADKSLEELQESYRDVNVEQYKVQLNDPVGTADLGLVNAKVDIENQYRNGWQNAETKFIAQMIITIKGQEDKVLEAESTIKSALDREIIKHWEPEDLHLEAFLAGLLVPRSEPKFYFEVSSTLAAKLVSMTNINTRSDKKGLYFGKDRHTLANVVKDLSKLPANHLILFGGTGSGKSYSAQVLLMRIKDILGRRIVYITNKAPDRRLGAVTDYEAVANFYEGDSSVTFIGDKKFGVNPLQMVIDEKNMQPGDYEHVWDTYRRAISVFFKKIVGKDWSPNMEGLLEDNLDTVYETAKIFRNKPESWKRTWPKITQLRDIWWKMITTDKEKYSHEDRRTAGALYRKTRAMKPGGTMEYLLADTNLEYKDWMVISLHKVDERIQDALYILMTNLVSMRFNIDTSKDTVVFVDEARAFIQDAEVGKYLLDGVTKWRSKGVALWLSTQQPADLVKSGMEEEFATNIYMSIVMGAKLNTKTVGYVQKYFGLSDSVTQDLLTCNQGEGILIYNGDGGEEITPIRFEPTPLESDVIGGRYNGEKALPICGYRLYDVFNQKGIDGKNFVEKNHFFMKTMIEEGDESAVIAEGWLKHNIPTILGKQGSTNIYYKPGTLDWDSGMVTAPEYGYGTMKIDHLHTVLQKGAFLMMREHKTRINHNNYADLEFEIIGDDGKIRVYGGEYEEAGTHDKDELNKKWGRLQKYDDYRFITTDVKDLVAKGIPERYIVKRGKEFVDWVISLEQLSATDNDSNVENMSQNLVTEDEELEQKTVTEEGIKYEKYKIRLRDMRAKKLSLDGVETEPINDGETEIGAL